MARATSSFVHQDLGLAPSLSVLDNLRVGRYARHRIGPIRWRSERKLAQHALDLFDLDWALDQQVVSLGDTARALLAIARAVADMETGGAGHGLLVLDEPTVYLPGDGVDRLFQAMRTIADRGHAVLFVTHQLSEIKEVTDRVTVLRDGRVVASAPTDELDEVQLTELIVGRQLAQAAAPTGAARVYEPALEVRGLEGPIVRDLSFLVGSGEVLGLTGLVGAGFDEIPYLLYGAVRAHRGTLTLPDLTCDVRRMTPAKAQRAGLALIPGNRQRDGVALELSVQDNIALPALGRFLRPAGISWSGLRARVGELADEFDVLPRDPSLKIRMLSGGNQQKAVLAKWLQTDPRLLLAHEPTQGVDVGARAQIHQLIRAAATRGTAVVLSSSEYEDLPELCDRVIVFTRGRAAVELAGAGLTVDALHDAAYSVSDPIGVRR
jgi:ribose transport system ATP-binding protein